MLEEYIKDSKYGTVGCVALDVNGNISAGTSTGGRSNLVSMELEFLDKCFSIRFKRTKFIT